MNYDEALNFIKNKQSLGIKPGLSRIKKVLNYFDNPQDKIKIIHIAGTNGKGTVATTIAKALENNGKRVGLFTSPWLVDYREQIQINGKMIPKEHFANMVENINKCEFTAYLTEFEMITVIMYKYFCDMAVDYAVVECGMGGLEDATNVEKENVAVITSISLDHTDFLGETLDKIIAQKEGIIKPNCPCFRFESTGDFNTDNLTLAKKVVSHLGFDDNIELIKPPARQQRVNGVLLDGGHNVEAAKALAPIINDETAVIGMMKDKDVYGYMSLVATKCKKIYCVTPNNPRSMSALDLSVIAKEFCDNVIVVNSLQEAIKYEDVTLVCGSFYMIREIINNLL